MIVNSRSEPDYEINSSYSEINDSFSFFGPMRMAFFDDGQAIEEKGFVKLILTICLTVIMILSIIGNVCTCAVIARDKTMRTPTNCYLLNLAITDLMIGLFIPIEIYMVWVPDNYPLGEQGCRIHFVLLDCLSNCSILTIVAFTIERYLVVSKPFLRQKLALNRRVFKIVAIIWIIACIFCIPDLFYIDLLARTKYAYCYFYQPDALKTLIIIEILVFFMMPGAALFIFYVLIALKLKSAQLKLRSSPIDQRQNRDKAVNLLAAVAVSFFFCWTPYCIFRFMMVIPTFEDEDYYYVWRIMNYLSYNGYTSTAVNPILYSLMSQKFRQAFKDFLKGRNSMRSRNRKGSSGITNRSITQYMDSRFN